MNSNTPCDSTEFSSRIDSLLQLNVTSFVELAIVSPKLWQEFSAPEDRRRAAALLGWPARCSADAFDQMVLTDFVAVFLNSGVRTVEDLWRRHPYASEYLWRKRCLESILHLLGLDQTIALQAVELEHFMARCRNAGCFEIWRDIDRVGFRQAFRLGFVEGIAAQVPRRPAGGYPTQSS